MQTSHKNQNKYCKLESAVISSVQLIPMVLETLQKTLKNINSLFHDHRGRCKPRKAQQVLASIFSFVCHGEHAAAALTGGDKSPAAIPCGHPDRPTLCIFLIFCFIALTDSLQRAHCIICHHWDREAPLAPALLLRCDPMSLPARVDLAASLLSTAGLLTH